MLSFYLNVGESPCVVEDLNGLAHLVFVEWLVQLLRQVFEQPLGMLHTFTFDLDGRDCQALQAVESLFTSDTALGRNGRSRLLLRVGRRLLSSANGKPQPEGQA